jgi:putative PIN family toxin of toxin-antitoxin system
MRVVVDTNTIISAFFFPESTPRKAFDVCRKNGTLIVSLETFEELVDVIHRPKFKKYPLYAISEEFIEAWADEIERVTINETIVACKDPKDNKFLEAAIAGNADFIISGDSDLLDMKFFRGIEILSATKFLEMHS